MQLPLTRESGQEMVETTVVEGLRCRVGTYDDKIARSVRREYGVLPVEGRVVLDVGANIGAFSRDALLRGARHVIAIEPEQSNHACLVENLREFGDRVTIVRGCLDLTDGETEIWLSTSGINPGNTTQTQRRGRFSQRVPRVALARVMSEHRPESVKLDCEGAEYKIGRAELMPFHVRAVAAEVHISGFGMPVAESFIEEYTAQGWSPLRRIDIKPTLWHVLGAWSR